MNQNQSIEERALTPDEKTFLLNVERKDLCIMLNQCLSFTNEKIIERKKLIL